MAKKTAKDKLRPKQRHFAELYASDKEFFGNGTQAYIEAYSPNQAKPNWYKTARASAHQLLTNMNVLDYINELLDLTLNDQHVDKQLAFLVTQDAELNVKLGAIKEYNALKVRITKKIELSGEVVLSPPQIA